MKYRSSKPCLALLGLLTASSGAFPQTMENMVAVHVDGDQSAVIAFLPPSMQDSQDRDAAEAQERVGSAIESIKRCLGDGHIAYQVVFAERIAVRSRGHEETFELGHTVPLVGALLLRPGSHARILFAGGGPEALVRMLLPVAREYFGQRCETG